MLHVKTLINCLHCNGWGYRVIYANDNDIERSVTIDDHKMGLAHTYFYNCS